MAGTGSVYVTAVRAVGDIQATHQYDVDVRFDIAFDWGGYNNYGASYSITCDGSTQSGTSTFNVGSGGGSWVWTNIGGTKTFRITMPTSGAAKNIGLSATINTGVNPSTIAASGSHAFSAVTWQWTVSYNANGGSGAPGAQVKTYGTTLTLSSTKPTRTGYTFKGWATSSSGGVAYAAGGNYTANASVTLYAVWQINTYTVSYNANGGSGAPGSQSKTYGKNLTLSSTKPTRTNYDFLGWATSKSASSAQYSSGGTYTANASVTLYAVWKLAYWKPRISSLKVDRCDADGTLNSYGTCSKVTFKWECCQTAGANNVKTITIRHAVSGSTSYTSTAVSASGTSGNASQVIGSSGLSAENAYVIEVTVTDNKSGSTTASVILNGAAFTIDFKAGGKGVAIGKPAVNNGFEVCMDTTFERRTKFNRNPGGSWIDSKTPSKCVLEFLAPSSDGGYFPKLFFKSRSGNVLTFGEIDDYIGFYGIYAARTANGTDFSFRFRTTDGSLEYIGKQLVVQSNIVSSGHVYLNNNKSVLAKSTDGVHRELIGMNSNNTTHVGYGGYAAKIGGTHIYGHNIYMVPRGHVYINGRAYGDNKVLWSGVLYMSADHTATLSESINSQPHGVVLVFSAYETSGVGDYHWTSHFVPKSVVNAHQDKGHAFFMTNAETNRVAVKYLYLSPTKIRGYSGNMNTSGGIVTAGKYFVLRYVIGV